jgi:type I restriction enzyme S subunit
MVTKFCDENDILIGRYGASIGKILTGMSGAYNVAIVKVIFDQNLLSPQYVYYLLKSSQFQDRIVGINRSAQSGFNKGDTFPIPLPLPPLAEQKRIVERVDGLLEQTRRLEAELAGAKQALRTLHGAAVRDLLNAADVEDFAAQWQLMADNFDALYDETYPEAALANVAELKQAILQLAVQGKLTRQEPEDEPAGELLKRIAAEKKRLGIKSQKMTEIGEGERPYALPEGWEWERAGIVFQVQSGYAFKSNSCTREGIRLVRNINIGHGEINWDKTAFILESEREEFKKFKLAEGDILINELNHYLW